MAYSMLPQRPVGQASFPAAGGVLGSQPRPGGVLGQRGSIRQSYMESGDEYPFLNRLYNNKNALLGLAAGLLSDGGWGAGFQGAMQGRQIDQEGRDRTEAQRLQAERDQAVREALIATGMDPAQVDMVMRISPDAAGGAAVQSIIPSQPNGEAVETQVMRGPDGEPHRMGWNPRTQRYDIDMGVAASTEPGTNINLPGEPTIGAIPAGYQAIQDPVTGAWRYERIPGGPQDEAATTAREEEVNTAGVVVEDINRALGMAGTWTTGFLGNIAQAIPGTPAHDLGRLLDTIAANVGFAELQQMRAASPTGGALGQVTVRELELLQATMGSLAQSQSPTQFRENLERLRSQYLDIIHGPGNWTLGEGGQVTIGQPQGGGQTFPNAPPVGTIEQGYRFLGGDPANQNNWQRVN